MVVVGPAAKTPTEPSTIDMIIIAETMINTILWRLKIPGNDIALFSLFNIFSFFSLDIHS
jgi:hypothetical protein